MPAVSRKQQRFMGLVRRAQKTGNASSPEVAEVAASMSKSDVKDFASTKHKGLPEKKMKKEDYKYPLYAPYTKVDEFHANKRPLDEEDYDRMKDRRMERGGVGGNQRPNFAPGPKKSGKKYDGMGALDFVKKSIRAKHGKGAIIDTKKEGYAPGDVDQKLGAVTAIPKKDQDDARARILAKAKAKREARLKKEEVILERGDFWHPDPEKDKKLGGPGANQRAREDRGSTPAKKEDPKKLRKGESYMDYAKRQKGGSSLSAKPKKKSLLGRLGLKKEEFQINEGEKKTPYGKMNDKMRKLYDDGSPKATERRRKIATAVLGNAALSLIRKEDWQKTYKEFIAEGNRTGRMMQKSKTQVTGHISADRGSDEKKNREGRKTLEKDLKKHGIGHKKGVGEYKYGSGETGREVSYQTSKPAKMSKRRFGKVMRRLGRKHGQESVITKDKDKSAKLHYTEKGSKAKSDSIGKTKAGKHPEGYGETSGTKVRGGKLPKKTNKGAYHYG